MLFDIGIFLQISFDSIDTQYNKNKCVTSNYVR